jgi:GT2 family glycosyltransferase
VGGHGDHRVQVLVSFLIANWNSGRLLHECAQSLLGQTHVEFEVIIVDNGSTDGSEEIEALADHRFTLIKLPVNVGFSEANNTAYTHSRGEIVVLLNNDVELDSHWTKEVLEAMSSQPGIGSVACQLRQKEKPALLDSAGFSLYTCGSVFSWYDWHPDSVDHAKYRLFGPVAAAAAYRRLALNEVGLFSPEYFAYYEDTDLAFRLNLAGYKCVYAKAAKGTHCGSATGKKASDFQRFQLRRNIEYLFFSNMQGWLVWRCLPAHLSYEALALFGMAVQGQAGVWFKAKAAAWRMRRWISLRRQRTRALLDKQGNLSARLKQVVSLLIPTTRLLSDRKGCAPSP